MIKQRANYLPPIGLELKINVAQVVSDEQIHGSYVVRLKYDAQTQTWRVLPKTQKGGLLTFLNDPPPANGNTLRIVSINKFGKGAHANVLHIEGNDTPANPFGDDEPVSGSDADTPADPFSNS